MVALQRICAQENAARNNVILGKLEGNNPAGSVKDRPALSMIQRAQEPAGVASLVLTTHQSDERAMRATLVRLGRLRCVLERPLLLRIGDFGD